MMKFLFILAILPTLCLAQTPCPQRGSSKSKAYQYSDSLKNRNVLGKTVKKISLSKLLAPGDDRKRFNANMYIQTTGYVISIKKGGPENCNCNTQDVTKHDLHIFLSRSLTDLKNKIVVELTPYSYSLHPEYQTAAYQLALVGKKITVTGWLFWDYQHFRNATNTIPFSANPGPVWRKTCWEVHPITEIKILQ